MERIPHTTDKMDLTVFRDRTICWRLVALGRFAGKSGRGIWDLGSGRRLDFGGRYRALVSRICQACRSLTVRT